MLPATQAACRYLYILLNFIQFYSMKKIFCVISGLLTLLFTFRSGAQDANPIKDKTLLWRISGKHLAKPSYLFGTMHLICRQDFIWTDKMKEGLTKSEK